MAKSKVTAQDMASRLMGVGTAPAATPTPKPKNAAGSSKCVAISSPASSEKKSTHPTKKVRGTKRLNLNISIQQWRKLKRYAIDNNESVSDVIRDCINSL